VEFNDKQPYSVIPINQPIQSVVTIIGSKSISHRALLIAALAKGQSVIENLSKCEDVLLTKYGLENLGIQIEERLQKTIITGCNGIIPKAPQSLNFKDSATSYRFFMSLVSLLDISIKLFGSDEMNQRPIEELVLILRKGGVKIKYLEKEGFSPIEIRGPFAGGMFHLSKIKSSQYISSLLIVGPLLNQGITLSIDNSPPSAPYIDITCDIQQKFGILPKRTSQGKNTKYIIHKNQEYSARNFTIEGDFSGAAFFFVAGAILGGKITIKGLNSQSIQGDRYILDILREMGCKIGIHDDSVSLTRTPSQILSSVNKDMKNYPDLVLPLAIAAIFADSPSTFYNLHHLQYKESNRLKVLQQNLEQIGVKATSTNYSIKIYPTSNLHGNKINPHNDHRVAMSFAIAGLKIPGIKILNPRCVRKSFPDFFEQLKDLQSRKDM
jgi:3-phosphoshikimate 1-carboxyvinyltransferase